MLKCVVLVNLIIVLHLNNALTQRIVGGHATTIEGRPYQAAILIILQNSGRLAHHCGASIISKTFLLTAAHCAVNTKTESFARVGSTNVNYGGHLLRIKNFRRHPRYNTRSLDCDFAIVSFPKDVEIALGTSVQIVLLPEVGQDPAAGSLVTVSGWGQIDDINQVSPTILQEIDLPVWSNRNCSVVYNDLTSRQICFGGTSKGSSSACFGDSGGPAVQGTPPVQYGTVSGGDSCSAPNVPGIYGKISTVRSWIKEVSGV